MIGPLMVPALTSAWGAAAAGLERVMNGGAAAWTDVETAPRVKAIGEETDMEFVGSHR